LKTYKINDILLVSKVLIISWTIFISIFFFGPISYKYSPYLFTLIGIFFVGFYIGIFFFKFLPKKINKNGISIISSPLIATICIYGIFFYLSIIVYDFLIKGAVLEYGITVYREMLTLEGRRNSMLGFLNIFFSGMPIIGASLVLLYDKTEIGNKKFYILAFFSYLGIFSFFLSGGRNLFVISLLILFFVYLLKDDKFKINIKNNFLYKIIFLVIILIGIFYVLYLFIERAELRNLTVLDTALNLEKDFGVTIIISPFDNQLISSFYYILVMLCFYLTHSFSLFSEYLFEGFSNYTYGVNTFPMVTMLIDKLFETTIYSDGINKLLLNGVYLSMIGRFYIDFGTFGVFILAFLLGIISVWGLSKSKNRNILFVVFSATILTSIFLMPMYNILSGTGFSIVLSLFIVSVCYKSIHFLRRFYV